MGCSSSRSPCFQTIWKPIPKPDLFLGRKLLPWKTPGFLSSFNKKGWWIHERWSFYKSPTVLVTFLISPKSRLFGATWPILGRIQNPLDPTPLLPGCDMVTDENFAWGFPTKTQTVMSSWWWLKHEYFGKHSSFWFKLHCCPVFHHPLASGNINFQ